jgi:hypothetical protein
VPQTSGKNQKKHISIMREVFLAIWKGCPWVPSDIACIKLYQLTSSFQGNAFKPPDQEAAKPAGKLPVW